MELDEAYSTGSSIMPQKKNPDVPELVRGKAGRVAGHLLALLMTVKGLPLAYNKDLQEDKEALFDTVDTLTACLSIFAPLIATLKVNRDRMRQAISGDFSTATDLADYLARRGLPFREAHAVWGAGAAVWTGEEPGGPLLKELSRPQRCLSLTPGSPDSGSGGSRDSSGGRPEQKTQLARAKALVEPNPPDEPDFISTPAPAGVLIANSHRVNIMGKRRCALTGTLSEKKSGEGNVR